MNGPTLSKEWTMSSRGEVITDRVNTILRSTGWSSSQLAEQVGVSRRAVEFWLAGKATSYELIDRIEQLENRLTSPVPVAPGDPPAPRINHLAFSSKAFAVRKGLSMTQGELGKLLNVSGRTYGRLEAGSAVPSAQIRKSIVRAYKELYGYRYEPDKVLKWMRGGEPKPTPPREAEKAAQQQLFETFSQRGHAVYVSIKELNDRKDASRMCTEIRKARELTQAALGEVLGTNKARISRIERCRLTPSPDELEALRRITAGAEREAIQEASVVQEVQEVREEVQGPPLKFVEARTGTRDLTLTPQRFAQLMRLMEWLQGIPGETVDVLRSLTPTEWEYLQGALP
jgi:transcriptional regulator with XRE-family HTH domain